MSERTGIIAVTVIGCACVASAALGLPPAAQPATPPPAAAPVAGGPGLAASALGLYTPPACVPGVPFSDITCTTGFDPWIEQFGLDGITAGCGGGLYCPGSPVTRDQMAVFIEKAMRGTANWPAHTQLVWAVKAADGTPDPVASGTALLNAVAAIPGSGNDAPSASNPWLLKIGPGIYDLGTGTVDLPAYVSAEGSGESATTIQETNSNPFVFNCAGNGEVSSLTALSTGTGSQAVGFWLAGSTTIRNVSVLAAGATSINVAVVTNHPGNSFFYDSDLAGIGGVNARGLENQNTTGAVLHGGTIEGVGGSSSNYSILNNSGSVWVTGTVFDGGVVNGSTTCAGVVDGAFVFYPSTCP